MAGIGSCYERMKFYTSLKEGICNVGIWQPDRRLYQTSKTKRSIENSGDKEEYFYLADFQIVQHLKHKCSASREATTQHPNEDV